MKKKEENKMKIEDKILIAVGGYQGRDVISIEEIYLTTEDDEYDTDEFNSFNEYVVESINDTASSYEQGFASVIVFNRSQIPDLIQKLSSYLNT